MRAALFAMAGLAALAGACESGKPHAPDAPDALAPRSAGRVEGLVTLRGGPAPPEGAVLETVLLRRSAGDGDWREVARERSAIRAAPPHRFSLAYDPQSIDPDALYVVRARILVNGVVRQESSIDHPVITRGGAQVVQIVVAPAR